MINANAHALFDAIAQLRYRSLGDLSRMYWAAIYSQEWYSIRAKVCAALGNIDQYEIFIDLAISAHCSAQDYAGRFLNGEDY